MRLMICLLLLTSLIGCTQESVKPDGFDVHVTFDENAEVNGGFTGFSWDIE